jgi:hypothetical protein
MALFRRGDVLFPAPTLAACRRWSLICAQPLPSSHAFLAPSGPEYASDLRNVRDRTQRVQSHSY